jgi:hypothetical protein
MNDFGGYQVGKTFVAHRAALVERLKTFQNAPDVQRECRRRQRVDEQLAKARQEARAREIAIPTTPDALTRKIVDLPTTVRIREGRLSITFNTTQDLIRQLFDVAQAMANDFEQFQRLCEPNAAQLPRPFVVKQPSIVCPYKCNYDFHYFAESLVLSCAWARHL